jgi:RND family efflux transporter MFP subunit
MIALQGCSADTPPEAPEVRPVRTVTVARGEASETASLTGQIEAEDEAALAFRIGGRMIERAVNVGDRVEGGQLVARLDPQDERNALRSAQAQLAAAQGVLTRTRNDFDRQSTLLGQGHTTRARFDQAEQALRSAQAEVDDAGAQLAIAHDRLSFTELQADAAGVVVAVAAEPGEVVQAGRTIVRLARQDGRDAVFDVPANLLRDAPGNAPITVALAGNPGTTAVGRVREVAPQADPATRTFRVRVGLDNPPPAMRLGSTVVGCVSLDLGPAITVPASALTKHERQPAVWLVDPETETVSLRNVEVARFDPASVVIAQGLDSGEIVVTAGVQALHPGQKVRLAEPVR